VYIEHTEAGDGQDLGLEDMAVGHHDSHVEIQRPKLIAERTCRSIRLKDRQALLQRHLLHRRRNQLTSRAALGPVGRPAPRAFIDDGHAPKGYLSGGAGEADTAEGWVLTPRQQ
jgi:hypothetical protein